jgi:hypothetical protein
LTPVGDGDDGGGGESREPVAAAVTTSSADAGTSSEGTREYASFEETFEGEAKEKFGDLGPADTGQGGGGGRGGGGGGGRGGPRRNQRRGGPGRR